MEKRDEEEIEDASPFTKLLQNKLKKGLTPTQTKVTKPDGSVTLFEGMGLVQTTSSSTTSSVYGFVVDTKPDLSVGEVRSWLLVSSQDVASDITLVKQYGITHILSLLPGFLLNPEVKCQIMKHLVIDFYDEVCFDLINSLELPSSMEFILEAKNFGGKVLVHCNAGISRAPTVIILYLMQFEGLTFKEAFSTVMSVRPGSKPNQGFVHQVKEFERKKKIMNV